MLLREIVGQYSRRIHFCGYLTDNHLRFRMAERIVSCLTTVSGTWTMLRFREPSQWPAQPERNAITAQSNIWLTFRLIGLSSEFIRDCHPQYSHLLDQRIFRLAVDDRQVLQYACHVLDAEPGHDEHLDNGKNRVASSMTKLSSAPALLSR